MFVPLAREGWLQKLVATKLHPFGVWKVFWVELLEDGKLSWFDGAAKRRADFRQVRSGWGSQLGDNRPFSTRTGRLQAQKQLGAVHCYAPGARFTRMACLFIR